MIRSHHTLLSLATLASVGLTSFSAQAQPSGTGSGMMMGPGIMNRVMMGGMCSPKATGFVEWRIKQLEETIKPNDAQKAKLEDLKTASNKASEILRESCATSWPSTAPSRMEAMEKRIETMLQAIKTVRPAMDAFYATLTEEQKKQIDSGVGRHRFWRWRDRW